MLYTGMYVCLTPIVLVDLLGLQNLPIAFGMVLLFQCVGAVIGPPFAGMYRHIFSAIISLVQILFCMFIFINIIDNM